MSVMIKGMDMPESCFGCTFCSPLVIPDEIYFCDCPVVPDGLDITEAVEEDYRHSDCPLVEIPTPHGRLIDETIVLKRIKKSMGIKDLSFLYHAEKSVVNEIFHAPTVIEAERKEHND